jgi:hypothetical protein
MLPPSFLGKKHKAESIEKMRKAKLGKKMNAECCLKHSLKNSGNKNGRWRGGRRTDKDGYILIWIKNHPHADRDGYVREHRLIAEKALGRYLKETEIVHHIDGQKDKNYPSNLVICQDESYHQQIFHKEK